ncbi:MAG TPA: transglutaminase domain-containing protein, partial [Candidatus Nitrosotenuis sp.]|nr:transglutaminase domain-containing protein [Candidatus Nitrosotenuis sp.]
MLKKALWEIPTLIIWALAAGLLAHQTTVPGLEMVAAIFGAITGSTLSWFVSESRLRLPALWLAGLGLWGGVAALAGLARGGDLLPSLLGGSLAYRLGETLSWFVGAAVLVCLVRTTSNRWPVFLAVEVALVAAVAVDLFAGHRDGSIHRPFFLVDPLWGRGLDPLPVFLLLGALLAALLIVLAAGHSRKRSFLDLGCFLLLLLVVFLLLPWGRINHYLQQQAAGGQPQQGQQSGSAQEGQPPPGQAGQGSPSPRPGQPSPQGGQSGSPEQTPTSGEEESQGGPSSEITDLQFQNQQKRPQNVPVAVVLLGRDWTPPDGYYYFRQTAFSQFNGVRLVADASGRYDTDVAARFPVQPLALSGVPEEAGTHTSLDTTVALLSEHSRPFGLLNAVQLLPHKNPDPRRFLRAYGVRSAVLNRPLVELVGRTAGQDWDAATREHYLSYPEDPRYGKMAGELVAALPQDRRGDPLMRAAIIKLWMDKNCTYTLEADAHNQAPDPVASFLFGDRRGYCVMLSHAAVTLYRAAGVPARVAAGYAVDAANRGQGSSILIRSKDAHAWPEIYLDGVGWVPLDISPEKSEVPAEAPPDQGLQQMLGEMARGQNGSAEQDTQPEKQGQSLDLVEMLRQ